MHHSTSGSHCTIFKFSNPSKMIRLMRVRKELEMLEKNPPPGISCSSLDDGNLTQLEANILGGEGSPYEGGLFKLSVSIPESYPFQPPLVQFKTRIYHPNVDGAGRICLDLLKMPPKGGWKASLNISSILLSIRLLMNEPNPDDPLMPDIAKTFTNEPKVYQKIASDWTKEYASE